MIFVQHCHCKGHTNKKISFAHQTNNSSFLFVVDIYAPPTGNLRLVGSANNYEGRLEVFANGAWGTVCDDSFGNEEAIVACRQLGLETSSKYSGTL